MQRALNVARPAQREKLISANTWAEGTKPKRVYEVPGPAGLS